MTKQQIQDEAYETLIAAGVDEAFARDISSREGAAVKVIDSPTFALATAQMHPSPTYMAYGQYTQGFPAQAPTSGIGAAVGTGVSLLAGAISPSIKGKNYEVREDGAVRYSNGVFYDPNNDQIIYPPNDPDAQGSFAWFNKVQESWSKEKIETWRKRLKNEFGYDISTSGGWDQPFKMALTDYHTTRYKNLGKPLPLEQRTSSTASEFGGALDPAVLKQEVSMWFQEAYGDDPSEEEVLFWSKKFRQKARQLVETKGLEPGAAATVAQARIQNQFRETPAVAEQLEEVEEDEMDDRMRNSLISVSQLSSI